MADKYLQHLAAIPLFEGLSKKDLRQIARLANEIDVEEGLVLMEQGAAGREAFVIVEGTATVTRDGDEVAKLERGAPVGEMALITNEPRNATVTMTSASRVLVLGRREFTGLMDELPDLARALLNTLASRLSKHDQDLIG